MLSFFRRKKPQDTPDTPKTQHYSAEELAAAFPSAATAASKAADAVTTAEPNPAAAPLPAESASEALVEAPAIPEVPVAALAISRTADETIPAVQAAPSAATAPAIPAAAVAPAQPLPGAPALPAMTAADTAGQARPTHTAAPAPAVSGMPATSAPTVETAPAATAQASTASPASIPHATPSIAEAPAPAAVQAVPAAATTPATDALAAPLAPATPTALLTAAQPVSTTAATSPAPSARATPSIATAAPSTTVTPSVAATPVASTQPAATVAATSSDGDELISANAAAAAPAGKVGWRERLRNSSFARSFGGLFSRNPKLDDDLLDEIETALITADVGVPATTALVEDLRKRMKSREFADANALLAALRADLIAMLRPVAKPLLIDRDAKPFVILTIGVNGVGKTTTIGKLAKRFKDEGHSLMLAAGDTFRAAAVAQLQIWGERNGVAVVAQGQNADAASVAFDALQAGKARGTGVLIADTAGRLHTQTGLMNELSKIRRVLGKVDATAPHEVLMVIDGTTGQNALSQLRQFHAAAGVTGLVVTKLDGTAKGGVVFALAREFGIPIRFAGIGERPEDLRVFDPEAFVDALLPEALGSSQA